MTATAKKPAKKAPASKPSPAPVKPAKAKPTATWAPLPAKEIAAKVAGKRVHLLTGGQNPKHGKSAKRFDLTRRA